MVVVLIHLVLLPVAVAMVWRITRCPVGRALVEVGGATAGFGLAVVGTAVVTLDVGAVFFGLLQALAWLLFLYLPGVLAVAAVRCRGALRLATGALAVLLVAVGIDAVLIEPFDLQVRRTTVPVPGLSAPLRIALVADLQTDRVGDHERAAVRAVADAEPDLVLFAGDYIQLEDPVALQAERRALATTWSTAGPTPPLGAFAVQGDVDRPGWGAAFDPRDVHVAAAPIERHALGKIDLVLLDLDTSRAPLTAPLRPRPEAELTLVLGHRPDFSLGLEDAGPDTLLLAGHTHGGQVQLPLIGPLVTFSQVSRDRARGRSTLAGGATLVVSAGVGLERSTAPRLRFLCPPEVWIVDVVPAP